MYEIFIVTFGLVFHMDLAHPKEWILQTGHLRGITHSRVAILSSLW